MNQLASCQWLAQCDPLLVGSLRDWSLREPQSAGTFALREQGGVSASQPLAPTCWGLDSVA